MQQRDKTITELKKVIEQLEKRLNHDVQLQKKRIRTSYKKFSQLSSSGQCRQSTKLEKRISEEFSPTSKKLIVSSLSKRLLTPIKKTPETSNKRSRNNKKMRGEDDVRITTLLDITPYTREKLKKELGKLGLDVFSSTLMFKQIRTQEQNFYSYSVKIIDDVSVLLIDNVKLAITSRIQRLHESEKLKYFNEKPEKILLCVVGDKGNIFLQILYILSIFRRFLCKISFVNRKC